MGEMMTEYTDHQLVKLLAERCENAGAQSAFARKHGVSETLVSLTLAGKKPVGKTIARALGYRNAWVCALQAKNKGAQNNRPNDARTSPGPDQ